MKQIKFYKVNEPYGFFSNFSPHPIFIENEKWNTVEHYFQASKFQELEIKKKIQSIQSPMQAAIEGRNIQNILREDWDLIKEDIMYNALKSKFTQHPKLMSELLSLKGCLIIEHTKNDNYWGDGGNGTGQNRLGVLLMKLRDCLSNEMHDNSLVLPPWKAFPTIDQYDLFWRMGLGEEYLFQWSKYYLSINQIEYKNKYPEPNEWEGIYD
jgi:N-glycosidase YbiA